ncbi:BatD family protein [Prolixibacteraceae bacterium]|nr:BatD family protein [Prolixibacteraceae bacterium]
MKNINNNIWMLVLLLFISWSVNAKDTVKVSAKVDSTNILLGDQINLTFDVEPKEGDSITFPTFSDTIISKVEILNGPTLDTLKQDDKSIVRASYLITSFDSGQYQIPRFPILLQKAGLTDTLFTPSVAFHVHAMRLRKEDAIFDIKKPYEAPITLEEITPWILGFLLIISIILITLYAIYRYKNKKPFFSGPVEQEEPYEIKATRLLEELMKQYPKTKEEVKPFYVNLTDIVREYLSKRFEVSTLELTTDEIVDSLRNVNSANEYRQEVRIIEEVLRLSDMVKFAKYIPEESEHPRQLKISLHFVETTKPKIVKIEEEEESKAGNDTSENINVVKLKDLAVTLTDEPEDAEKDPHQNYYPKADLSLSKDKLNNNGRQHQNTPSPDGINKEEDDDNFSKYGPNNNQG